MRVFSFIIVFFIAQNLFSQNLVPDSSFENNKAIPTDFSGIGNSKSWTRPSMGTTDLFCVPEHKKKGYSIVGIPQNAMGSQFAHSGNAYAGFFLFSHGDYREYLQTPLVKPLEKGKTYFISMYVSLADYARTYIDQLGVAFLPGEEHFETSDQLDLSCTYLKMDKVGSDAKDWHRLTVKYKAKGTEKYMVIGSFKINKVKRTRFDFPKDMKTPINKTSERDAYYFIDDVSVVEWFNAPEEIKKDTVLVLKDDTLRPGKAEVLKNILFKTGSAALEASSYEDLDKLLNFLISNPGSKIKIDGYTDNTGTSGLNEKLSVERAKEVARYLVRKGIRKNRIQARGFGDSDPLVENDTEEHKAINRRVEIIFSK